MSSQNERVLSEFAHNYKVKIMHKILEIISKIIFKVQE